MYAHRASRGQASAYAQLGTETAVLSASPHQLITMLFDAAAAAMALARHHMLEGRTAAKGQSISRAIEIVDSGLRAGLDAAAGGAAGAELVANLQALYGYVITCLMKANLHNDPARLEEAQRLLESVASAWRDIEAPAPAQRLPATAPGHS